MLFDDRNNHEEKLRFMVKDLEESVHHRDLAGVERACENIHLYLRDCAVRGKYSFIGKTVTAIENMISDRDRLPEQLIVLDEFPVSLQGYMTISRSSDDPALQLALVQNIITHQTLAPYRYDRFDSWLTCVSRTLSKPGNEAALVMLLNDTAEINQDMVLILFMSTYREMNHQSDIIASWVRENFPFFQNFVGIPQEFYPTFSQWTDFRSFDCPVSDETLLHSKMGDLDLLYYRQKLKLPVPSIIFNNIQSCGSPNARAMVAAYAIVYDTDHWLIPSKPNERDLDVLITAAKHCAFAVDRGMLQSSDALIERVANYLDRMLVRMKPKNVDQVIEELPSAWVVNSQQCRTTALERDLGL